MKKYIAALLPAVEGGYSIEFPDFPEAFSQGDDFAEAVEMGEDALSIAVEEYTRAKRNLPEPSSLAEVRAWAESQRQQPGIVANGEILYQMYTAPSVELTPVRINISLAKSILERLDSKAKALGMTRSGFIAAATQAYPA